MESLFPVSSAREPRPGYFARATFAWYDSLRWVRGRHNFVFGGSYEHDRWNKLNALNSYGVFTFSGDATGSALADFLLGKLRTFQQGNGQRQSNRYKLYSLFPGQLKATSRVTLTYGLRWEPSLPWHEMYHEVEVFRPDLYAKGVKSQVFINTPPGMLFAGDPGVAEDGRSPDYKTFAPELALLMMYSAMERRVFEAVAEYFSIPGSRDR